MIDSPRAGIAGAGSPQDSPARPSFPEMVRVFARIGCLSFGGPAGQIALMHRELVEERAWIAEPHYLRALNFCNLLPGPEAQQLATYIGWRLHGIRGGLAGGLLFVIPGALVVLALSVFYVLNAKTAWFGALFLGIKAAVLALVVQALIRIGRRALNSRFKYGLAIASFLALFLLDIPFPVVVLAAGSLGMIMADRVGAPHTTPNRQSTGDETPVRDTMVTIGAWSAIWAGPILVVALTLGTDHVLFVIGLFFSKLAVVTFGGAYAVLAYMAQEAVNGYGWLTAREMADGLGLAETTPGPLILVNQFVGFIGAYRAPAPFVPMIAGILGALITLWATFAPCFLWIFAFAPWIERLEGARKLHAGMSAITAAIVGVIANLALWFALHVLFTSVADTQVGPFSLHIPNPRSADMAAFILAALAFVLIFRTKLGVLPTLALCSGGGLMLDRLF